MSLIILAGFSNQDTTESNAGPAVEVVSFKWSRVRRSMPADDVNPPAARTTQSRAIEGQRKDPVPDGHRPLQDPDMDTIQTRSAQLDQISQGARTRKTVDGFVYTVKVLNANPKAVTGLIWEYEFKESLNPTNVVRRQFICRANLKPEKQKEFQVFSTLGPSSVISVESLSNKGKNLFEENVLIDFVEYSDGSFWQQKDWNSEMASQARDLLRKKSSAQCQAR